MEQLQVLVMYRQMQAIYYIAFS